MSVNVSAKDYKQFHMISLVFFFFIIFLTRPILKSFSKEKNKKKNKKTTDIGYRQIQNIPFNVRGCNETIHDAEEKSVFFIFILSLVKTSQCKRSAASDEREC